MHHYNNHHHEHEHDHEHHHEHEYEHGSAHRDGNRTSMAESKTEAVAFLKYTLQHNAHHEEELSGLENRLRNLGLEKEAQEIRLCMADLERANNHLEAALGILKG